MSEWNLRYIYLNSHPNHNHNHHQHKFDLKEFDMYQTYHNINAPVKNYFILTSKTGIPTRFFYGARLLGIAEYVCIYYFRTLYKHLLSKFWYSCSLFDFWWFFQMKTNDQIKTDNCVNTTKIWKIIKFSPNFWYVNFLTEVTYYFLKLTVDVRKSK